MYSNVNDEPVRYTCTLYKDLSGHFTYYGNVLWNIKQVKLATVVEVNTKAPFPIATTPRCRGGFYFFLWIAPLIMLSVKQGGVKYHFWVFGITRPMIEPQSPRLLLNTIPARPTKCKQVDCRKFHIFFCNQHKAAMLFWMLLL